MKMISWIFLVTFLFASIFGCSLFSSKEEAPPQMVRQETRPAPVVQKPLVRRELGSLWSDNSSWNQFYGGKTGKSVGELLVIRPTEGFRMRVVQVAKPTPIVEENSKEAPKEADVMTKKENSNLIATIQEALPNGLYLVTAKQNLRINQKDYWLEMTGKLREQSVLAETELTADELFDLSLDVKGPPLPPPQEVKKVATEKPAEPEKPKTAEAESERKGRS
jgi:hypothetical protein